MTKRKLLRYLVRRIEYLERRVADLEAIVAAVPAAEPVTFVFTWLPGDDRTDTATWGSAKVQASKPDARYLDMLNSLGQCRCTVVPSETGEPLQTFPNAADFARYEPGELRI
ncbi:MAG: hypothetical protein EHM35_00415 [Planctomycetaceae bacterium]|nr:MAG: hypothetical protein EHM35_00415 [Planctomycetaceae bacterium]